MANEESSGAIDRFLPSFLPPDFTIFALSAPGMQRGAGQIPRAKDDEEAELSSFLPRSNFFWQFHQILRVDPSSTIDQTNFPASFDCRSASFCPSLSPLCDLTQEEETATAAGAVAQRYR